MEKEYRFAVEMVGYPTLHIHAPDKLTATHRAAAEWGVTWRETARNMIVYQLGREPVKK